MGCNFSGYSIDVHTPYTHQVLIWKQAPVKEEGSQNRLPLSSFTEEKGEHKEWSPNR